GLTELTELTEGTEVTEPPSEPLRGLLSCVSSVAGFRVDVVDRGRRPTSDLVLHRAVSDPSVVLEPIEPRVELSRLSEPCLIRPVGVTLRERGFVEGLDPAEQRPSVVHCSVSCHQPIRRDRMSKEIVADTSSRDECLFRNGFPVGGREVRREMQQTGNADHCPGELRCPVRQHPELGTRRESRLEPALKIEQT